MAVTEELIETRKDGAKRGWVEVAKDLSQLIISEADKAEEAGQLTQPVIDAFFATGLHDLVVPAELGGSDAGLVDYLEVVEEISRADASTGWNCTVHMGMNSIAAAHISDAGAKAMWGGDAPVAIAGQVAPMGEAFREPGGYRVRGSYSFGSASAQATWMSGGAIVKNADGSPVLNDDGLPEMVVFYLPADKVDLKGGWDVLGLKATCSQDYLVPEQFVHEDFVISMDGANPWSPYLAPRRIGGVALAGTYFGVYGVHPGVVLGAAKRALEEVARIVQTKKRLYSDELVSSQPPFQREIVVADAKLRSARAYIFDLAREIDAICARRAEPVPEALMERLGQASIYAHMIALDVVETAYKWAGASALRRPSALGRAMLDIHAAVQHVSHDHIWLETFADNIVASRLAGE